MRPIGVDVAPALPAASVELSYPGVPRPRRAGDADVMNQAGGLQEIHIASSIVLVADPSAGWTNTTGPASPTVG